MKAVFPILLLTVLLILQGCKQEPENYKVLEIINNNILSGDLVRAINSADSLKKLFNTGSPQFYRADSLAQVAERIKIDFSIDEETVSSQIENRTGPFTNEQKAGWEKRGWLEYRIIDGEKKYFRRAASNLNLLKNFHEQKEKSQNASWQEPDNLLRLKHADEVYLASCNNANPVVPVNMAITYTITVEPDVVPEGEVIRCWLPFPRQDHPRQKNVELKETSNPQYKIAPDSSVHSTLYMEEVARKGVATVFRISFNYQSSAQHFNLHKIKILPYEKSAPEYKNYTREQLPQICFTDNIKRLADGITGNEENPAAIVSKIYLWFKENIPWTGALEYSIIPNIPEYVYHNRRGDCGMQTLLFMSMLRYRGIPVRWQSGWMVPPLGKNLHDWCEIYYEGVGWVPADVSYDLQNSVERSVKEFYMSGIDSYRMIINNGISGSLYPDKEYFRSEPYDFQRGEVEWRGGNLYFDKWDYEMNIEYLK